MPGKVQPKDKEQGKLGFWDGWVRLDLDVQLEGRMRSQSVQQKGMKTMQAAVRARRGVNEQ